MISTPNLATFDIISQKKTWHKLTAATPQQLNLSKKSISVAVVDPNFRGGAQKFVNPGGMNYHGNP